MDKFENNGVTYYYEKVAASMTNLTYSTLRNYRSQKIFADLEKENEIIKVGRQAYYSQKAIDSIRKRYEINIGGKAFSTMAEAAKYFGLTRPDISGYLRVKSIIDDVD